jgi:hypothetical protein
MSLINDALKKAQKQRTGETPSLASMPSVGGETPHRIARRAKPPGFDTLIIRAGVGAGVVLVLIIGGWFVLREKPETGNLKPEVVSSNQASAPSVGSPLAGGPSPVAAVADAGPASPRPATSAPAFTLPVASKPEPVAPATVAGVADPGLPASSRPVATTPAPASPTGADPRVSPFKAAASPRPATAPEPPDAKPQIPVSAAPPPKLEPRAIQFIENIKVAGIMARPTDSKVLMNDRVYRIGSLVEAEMGLTLVGITANSLTFEDGNGGRYTRTF